MKTNYKSWIYVAIACLSVPIVCSVFSSHIKIKNYLWFSIFIDSSGREILGINPHTRGTGHVYIPVAENDSHVVTYRINNHVPLRRVHLPFLVSSSVYYNRGIPVFMNPNSTTVGDKTETGGFVFWNWEVSSMRAHAQFAPDSKFITADTVQATSDPVTLSVDFEYKVNYNLLWLNFERIKTIPMQVKMDIHSLKTES